MTTKYLLTSVFAVSALAASAANPEISGVTAQVGRNGRQLTVAYALTGPTAIVTADIRTNGVSIGAANQWFLSGDVNRRVKAGPHAFTWRADRAWPSNLRSDVSVEVKAWPLDDPPDYLSVDLAVTDKVSNVSYYPSAEAVPFGVTNRYYKTFGLLMRRIHAKGQTFRMGGHAKEFGYSVRRTAHQVTLTNDYYMGIYELTYRQWGVMFDSYEVGVAWYKDGDRDVRPVESVSPENFRGPIQSDYANLWPRGGHTVGTNNNYIALIRKHCGLLFDLPTDAQWEFAARAGCGAMVYPGTDFFAKTDSYAELDKVAWTKHNSDSGNTLHEVGLLKPNAWGLYDVLGGVWEHVLDQPFGSAALTSDPVTEPVGDNRENENNRIRRGGSHTEEANCTNLSDRNYRGYSYSSSNVSKGSERNNGCRLWCAVEQPDLP